MLGAVTGDIIGSVYEFNNTHRYDFELFTPHSTFTDDTVLTVAVADCILHGKDYARTIWEYGNRYPDAGYGTRFQNWLGSKDLTPYNSFGNGSAMRVSPVGFAFDTLEATLAEARRSAEVTHNHPEGIKGAQAVAAAIFLARRGESKPRIKDYITSTFGYNLKRTLDEIRPNYTFDETCQGSVPEAIIAFLESTDFEDAIRKAVALGGDSDTIACITGSIGQAFYVGVPSHIVTEVRKRLDPPLLAIIDEFTEKYRL
ncbi:ADP-ribosylglycohydrolase family protein [Dehalogenimonas sp. 4OHTPN]|uniref:ADP-ribosylglycohydrolase family protein n=1 Tax=Dehalogenimonas sp. 4OHTPN TaxID=3166643 RepID=A0AAU8GBP1_9CHLR